ncbi:dienelactone hydrolase family protein [Paenibacillus silvisoli]|uniref:dienelactone hydrolase family protein n=1 Tax=Paenibacillus silvisoli TaxID=3110539 RepID=UPI0028047296|nr:dienelactone hydrolase family protein [Paenibacillus silvisoli]
MDRTALVIVLHEIYGVNDHIRLIGDLISKEGYDVLMPDLLGRDAFAYDQNEAAYRYFMDEIGFEQALETIRSLVSMNRSKYACICVIGFSIGATLAWLCSEIAEVDGVIGYYGSRIRSYTAIEPGCPVLLLFASQEKSFHVPELVHALAAKRDTIVETIQAEHGYMNPFYPAYNADEFRRGLEKALLFIKKAADK